MRTMFQSSGFAALVVALALSMSACGGSTTPTGPSPSPSPSPGPSPGPTGTPWSALPPLSAEAKDFIVRYNLEYSFSGGNSGP